MKDNVKNTKEYLKVSAPGNIFLFGEHAVVYERPAIVASIELRTKVKITDRSDNRVFVDSEGYGIINEEVDNLLESRYNSYEDYKDVMDPLRDLIASFFKSFSLYRGFEAWITSEIPRLSGGTSSSTAVLSAMLDALNELYDTSIELVEFFDWLYPFQVKVHGGKASGSEIQSSSIGGYNLVRLDKSGERPKLERKNLGKREYYLVIGNTGVESPTKETVLYVSKGLKKAKQDYEEIFDKIKEIVWAGEKAVLAGDVNLIGDLMNQNHELLARELGVAEQFAYNCVKCLKTP